MISVIMEYWSVSLHSLTAYLCCIVEVVVALVERFAKFPLCHMSPLNVKCFMSPHTCILLGSLAIYTRFLVSFVCRAIIATRVV